MPVRSNSSNIIIETARRATDIPSRVWDCMKKDPQSNIILPTAEKALHRERRGIISEDEFWLTCSTTTSTSRQVDFVLTVTNGPIREYPIFLWSARPIEDLTNEFLGRRMVYIVKELLALIPQRRVYSVFALDTVATAFADCWSEITGIGIVGDPYYAALFSFCSSTTLAAGRDAIDPSVILRPATRSDVSQTRLLCHGFATESEPFVLNMEDATREATLLTDNGQLYVYEDVETGAVPCIVAVTRKSGSVAAITKVYTDPKWRGRGCAAKLVHHVTNLLLNVEHMRYAVLYVAHNNVAASRVYDRVGFVGLKENDAHVPMVESWLELGFDRNCVKLGHW